MSTTQVLFRALSLIRREAPSRSCRCRVISPLRRTTASPRPINFHTVSRRLSKPGDAAASRPQNEYLVVIPDFPDTTAARAKAQPGHISCATPLIDARIITYCGVTLTGGADKTANGSAIVMKAESEEEIKVFLRNDEYTKLGVWNVEEAKIWPFRSG